MSFSLWARKVEEEQAVEVSYWKPGAGWVNGKMEEEEE